MQHLPPTNLDTGLSAVEAQNRLDQFGLNQLESKQDFSLIALFFNQLRSPLIYILLIAGLATIYLGEWIDASVILIVVAINTLLGFWQEYKAAKSLEALKSYLKPQVTVIRNSKHQVISLGKLVPGDLVLLNQGDSVPADGLVVEAEELGVNEALLTGESLTKTKSMAGKHISNATLSFHLPDIHSPEATSYLFMGTTISSGIGKMLVIATGPKTQMGQIATSLDNTQESATPLQRRLQGLAKTLMFLVIIFSAAIFALGIIQGKDLNIMFKTTIALAVAAIPEGLAVSMTVILALGMQRILRQKALVRKLVAAETLGSVTVICCDKTGTLTEGKMKIVAVEGDRDELIRGAILVSNRRDEESIAMYEWAKSQLLKTKVAWTGSTSIDQITKFYQRLDIEPFSSAKKFALSLHQSKSKNILVMAGAPEVVLKHCYMSNSSSRKLNQLIRKLAGQGHRLIAIASKQVRHGKIKPTMLTQLGWHGLLVFEDPIRPKVDTALKQAINSGIKVKIITGDHLITARAVLNKILGPDFIQSSKQVMEGTELARLTKSELASRIQDVVLFARTTPSQKLRLVEALKSQGEVVAMTGDGVNDAPALKAADIGVVVAEATDVSKQTADMVLLDSNFSTIVKAINEGRAIYQGMRRIVTYLLGSASQEIALIGGSLLLGLPLPLTAVQILWINLAVDGLPGVALAFDRHQGTHLNQPPINQSAPILDRQLISIIFVIGVVANLMILGLYSWLYGKGIDIATLSTFMFVTIGVNSLLYIFSVKDLNKNIWHIRLFDNHFLLLSVVVGLLLIFAAVSTEPLSSFLSTTHLGLLPWIGVFGISFATILMVEITKWFFFPNRIKHQS